jgi:hypothetical protein
MWTYAAVIKRSTRRPLVGTLPRLGVAAFGVSDLEDLSRNFSTSGGDGNNSGRQGGGERGGRDNNTNNTRNDRRGDPQGQQRHGRRPPPLKQNFAKQFLEPAARGELKNHQSGIPKLAGRRPKGHGVRGADPERRSDFDYDELAFAEEQVSFRQPPQPVQNKPKTGTIDAGSPLDELNADDLAEVHQFLAEYNSLAEIPDEQHYYWDESDYENFARPEEEELMEKLQLGVTKDADGKAVVEVDDDVFDWLAQNRDREPPKKERRDMRGGGGGRGERQGSDKDDDSPYTNIIDYVANNNKQVQLGAGYDAVTPITLVGPDMNDFVENMLLHPTKYAEFRHYNHHPESKREPRPDFPKNRANPPLEFVKEYTRFLYVTGLPPVMINGKLADFENPVHRHEIQKKIADIFDVESERVSPANLTSGFIGFYFREDQLFAMETGPTQKVFESPVTISKYEPAEDDSSFAKNSPGSIVLLENLPMGSSPAVLARTLFPSGTDVGEIYGSIKNADIMMKSSHTALLRLESAEMAESAVTSSMVQQRLEDMGQHPIRYMKARRELKFTGKHGGPDGTERIRELGSRLIVDGDIPTKKFFLSHAGTVHLRNLDPTVTKQQIADFFQPFCSVRRDVEGSVEFVKHNGLPTGKAYVGFDELGEAEAALSTFNGGRVLGLASDPVIMRSIKEVDRIKREKRQTRTDEELLDNLHNWEQYVDPADIELLIAHGFTKEALDEALISVRYRNPTFASLDQAMRSETLQPEKDSGGFYAELVQRYIAVLKDCIATPENPGEIFKSLFFQDEELDTSVFDDNEKRQAVLRKRREVP